MEESPREVIDLCTQLLISVIKHIKNLKGSTFRDLLIRVWPSNGNLYGCLKLFRRVMMGK